MARHARRLILWTTGVLLSLALLAMLGIAVLVWGVNPDIFRGRIERAATQALGRPVVLAGALRWQPGLNFRIESADGRIANAEGFGSSSLASWRALRLGVQLKPLLGRRLVIDHLELDGLQLSLARNARGANWTLPSPNTPPDEGLALALGSVALRDSAVSFTDESSGSAWSATALHLDIDLPPQLDAPQLRFSGLSLQARVNGAPLEPSGLALQVSVPRLDVDRAGSRLVAPEWQVKWNDATFSGALDATVGGTPAAEGSLRVQAPSLRRLLQSLSITAPGTSDASVLGALEASARFVVGEHSAALTQLDMQLDSTRVTGGLTLPALSPLSVRFDLAADQVDIDRYLAPADEPGTPLELPLAQLRALDAQGVLKIRHARLAGAAAREMRIDVD